ncbi:hypothetical protein A2331_02155 [Candidatus Falkowbacteria bacterium RIFOXYB2_FULL_34_18]|uniref:Uncharacterized protein n=1 Tax=Candidatus Falkowbacteria bacterium RIFOXYD2_FULL_34_120 TaxID=1798007 RepID=A0A1F5TQQ7_9BACT|nr:MAG: hypothetical protein A2331_02155 [Candidatus Falkowbacteria bacterium RIFOXYB2_FULL_34_18]OGF29528.1 MAG: hypothetical protein A2500_02375 [Candidatus Falkowbacteria bacterium RIFOXYC12_FULL_34_55]OGF36862.1 MAG: hypothetical protein A2466_06595 [Candidatus Falkowbacteria bacterium RIFOXYC2_FULL_34_220]OGF39061.1 MAG: hypothetical protein A2515_04600 [Candidatus Falkowbacteria bacterium RIFOXYD12_FULL_34_57]OGF41286.1 MAG: hypothetical protein A2531_00290 [Candidatus Falkowbacteria bact
MQRKHSLFIKKGKDKNVYTLFLGHLRGDDREIHNIVYNLHQAKSSDVLQIRISSSGGFVNHMLAIINVIYDKFYGRIITYIEKEACSAAGNFFTWKD